MLMPGTNLTLHFQLLGPGAHVHDGTTEFRVSKKGFALLAYLAMKRGDKVSRAILANLLWGDRGEAQARQSLRQTIFELRRDLGPHSAALVTDEQSVVLAADAAAVDVHQFASWAEDPAPANRLRCLDIPWGAFLDGFSTGAEAFDEWADGERHRLNLIATRAFAELAGHLDAAGDRDRAILALERLIAIDPSDEELHRRLLTLEARYRGAETALARAKWLAASLKRDLDVDPETATQTLVDDLRRRTNIALPEPAKPQDAPANATASPRAINVDRSSPSVRQWRFRPTAIAAGLAAIAVIGAVLWLAPGIVKPILNVWHAEGPSASRDSSTPSWQSPSSQFKIGATDLTGQGLVAIAVMPFKSYDEHGEAAKLAAAMISDDLTYSMSRLPTFRVISRQTMDSFRGRQIDAAAVGAELGVRYLLEGSVSVSESLLRVSVALIDAKTRLHLWSGRFEQTHINHNTIQDEIIAGICRETEIKVVQEESISTSADLDVHVSIFKGRAAMNAVPQRGPEAIKEAEAHFTKALEREPDSPRAQIGLAAVHTNMAVRLYASDPELHLAKAEALLKSVIGRYPNMSDGYALTGLVHVARRQNELATQAFKRAVELNPSDASSYAQLGRLLVSRGHAQDGLEHVRYAMRLSPRDPKLATWLAFSGYAKLELGQYDQAIGDLNEALRLYPGQPRTTLALIGALAMAGKESEAHRLLAKLQQAQPHLTNAALQKSYGSGRLAQRQMGQGILRVLKSDKRTDASAVVGGTTARP